MKDQDKGLLTPKDQNNKSNCKDPVSLNVEEKWLEVKEDYRRTYPMLTDKDLDFLPGKFSEMTDRIASKTQRCRSEVNNEIRYWNTGLLP
ncbi:hypothetical protein [Gelidibacter sp.]|uniref:hypothetical protein n=1 Tax=Gelidibacter sp. TaxID=2018083 RepID=UPI002CDDDB8A|nr:hypothetical protein [Gelidibacter sp.]HUH26617.1 hypothetical protein [Gelidibacter sp.]